MEEFFTSRFLIAGVLALVTTLLATPWVIKMAHRFEAIDQPGEERRIHTTPTPRWGGLAIYLGVLVAWLVVYPLMYRFRDVMWVGPVTANSLWIMGLSGAVVLFGMLDDKYQFKASRQAIFLLTCGVLLSHPSLGGIRIEGFTNFITDQYVVLSQLNSVLLTTVFYFCRYKNSRFDRRHRRIDRRYLRDHRFYHVLIGAAPAAADRRANGRRDRRMLRLLAL